MKAIIAKMLYEALSDFGWSPFWSGLSAGFLVVGGDGLIYQTAEGQDYLESLPAPVGCELCAVAA